MEDGWPAVLIRHTDGWEALGEDCLSLWWGFVFRTDARISHVFSVINAGALVIFRDEGEDWPSRVRQVMESSDIESPIVLEAPCSEREGLRASRYGLGGGGSSDRGVVQRVGGRVRLSLRCQGWAASFREAVPAGGHGSRSGGPRHCVLTALGDDVSLVGEDNSLVAADLRGILCPFRLWGCRRLAVVSLPDSLEEIPMHCFRRVFR
jgi:hypothetical protein